MSLCACAKFRVRKVYLESGKFALLELESSHGPIRLCDLNYLALISCLSSKKKTVHTQYNWVSEFHQKGGDSNAIPTASRLMCNFFLFVMRKDNICGVLLWFESHFISSLGEVCECLTASGVGLCYLLWCMLLQMLHPQ